MDMQSLHLRDRRGYLGAREISRVKAEFEHGQYRPDTMSWCPGEPSWTSLGRRWSPRRTPWLRVCGIAALIGCLALGVALPLWGMHAPGPPPLPLAWHLGLFAVSLLLTAAVLGVAVKRDPGYGTSPAWTSVWLLISALPLIATLLFQQIENDRIRHEETDARMRLSADKRVLRIDGFISANFVPDFKAAIAQAPHLQRIDILSGGGLVEDALEVAKIVRARELVVRVDDRCASACTLLWAASPAPELGLHGSIGLHQTSTPSRSPKEWRESALQHVETQSREILLRAGFGPDLLSKRSHTPPTSVAWVDAIELIDSGVSLRVVDAQGRQATPAALAMAGALHQMNASDATWRAYLAYADKQPDPVLQRAPAIRQALLAKDKEIAIAWLRRLYIELNAFAFGRSSDADLVRWGQGTAALWEHAARTRNKAQCNALLNNDARLQDQRTHARVRELLADLVEAASLKQPQQDVPETARNAVQVRYNALFWERVASQKATFNWAASSPLWRCGATAQLYQETLSRPAPQAAASLRALRSLYFE
ncbi:hypothetical protein K6982_00930 [Xanthomonas cucurbitae]|uniref:Uncharacterized protein n=2 Tax=Xanthomonas TaxID=338 RepID=A0A2S7DKL7_9XANT|nr:hypothetical protein XcuCFBP2542_15285 [Xanthomonas cucurbitae]QHG88924.1 hypothetical protein EBN15_00960 [Xanthomonas cucurbitae]WDM77210.1 hypothetical protein K6982_00930 [Xanthomonas cucurbitae]WDM80862.1 hypothetical protein K6980_00915 [Xanthomonas cucurbitae]WDM84559.1 hypothetical protein K6979_00925 [Xanthomonas cucurbitae]